MARALLCILDSLGIGHAPDAAAFGDAGANTLATLARWSLAERGRPLAIPHLLSLGLADAAAQAGSWPDGLGPQALAGAAGACNELSNGKDTPSGHWEMAGVPVIAPWGYFPERHNSLPASLVAAIAAAAGTAGVLGNCHASGTTILEQLGEQHLACGWPIVYTSADSVVQIAAHEQQFGLERLLTLCEQTRLLCDPYRIGRVIARPFTGDNGASFKRTANRRDYAMPPPAPTLLQRLTDAGGTVVAVGKVADIFAHIGISRMVKASGRDTLMAATLEALTRADRQTLVVTNFVDFDTLYGHRRDIQGYADELEAFDLLLPQLLAALQPGDLLVLTADHGCDPAWPGTDHTRERVPLLVAGPGVRPQQLGVRASMADIGATLSDHLQLAPTGVGHSFYAELYS